MKKSTWIGIVVFAIVAVALYMVFFESTSYKSKKACKKYVLSVLKSPGSANFVAIEDISNNDEAIKYNISVDSQNGFGALVRSNISCTYDKRIEQAFDGKYSNGEDFLKGSMEILQNSTSE